MSQSPIHKPVQRAPDFKARFGVVPDAPPPKLTRLQARKQKRGRLRLGAIFFSLLLGSAGSAAFFVAKDMKGFATLFSRGASEISTPAKIAQAPAAAPVNKSTMAESPVLLPDPEPAPVAKAPPEPIAAAAAPEAVAPPEPEAAEEPVVVATAAAAVPPAVNAPAPAVEAPPQIAMAAPAVTIEEPVAATPVAKGGSTIALVTGQVFRDCENCPDVVVVVPPRPVIGANDVQVTRNIEMPDMAPFAIGRFEVTFDDWGRCMAGGGCRDIPDDEGWGRNTRPVINVSHEMATEQYLAWLSKVTGATYRLPTAAEWDLSETGAGTAPVGGITLIDAQTVCLSGNYSSAGGTTDGEAACADGFPSTAPAGSLKPNSLGLADMRGNVWEWLSDCWSPGFKYKPKPEEQDCHKRLLRGGSWSSRALLSAIPARGFEAVTRTSKTIGFRVARTLP